MRNAALADLIWRRRGAGALSPDAEAGAALGVAVVEEEAEEEDAEDEAEKDLGDMGGMPGAARMWLVTCSARVGRVDLKRQAE